MTREESLHERWRRVAGDHFLEFDHVSPKRSLRQDLHAFLLLDELFPGTGDMICHSEHDEIWLAIGDEQVETLTDEQMVELSRCGVLHSSDGGLSMFT